MVSEAVEILLAYTHFVYGATKATNFSVNRSPRLPVYKTGKHIVARIGKNSCAGKVIVGIIMAFIFNASGDESQ
jgi:hypothetical protein